jgi:Raf kinase inhibitor-like YbhB/YbcL family protein
MSKFYINSSNFEEGKEIPKKFGYKHGNQVPEILFFNQPENTKGLALIMDDPDAMAAVGKVWLHWLAYGSINPGNVNFGNLLVSGKTDFGEIGYGGPAPPDKRHTYIFKGYALDIVLDLKKGFSKQELEDAMKGHIIAESKLTGTFTP